VGLRRSAQCKVGEIGLSKNDGLGTEPRFLAIVAVSEHCSDDLTILQRLAACSKYQLSHSPASPHFATSRQLPRTHGLPLRCDKFLRLQLRQSIRGACDSFVQVMARLHGVGPCAVVVSNRLKQRNARGQPLFALRKTRATLSLKA
jgi:hypothetical protein